MVVTLLLLAACEPDVYLNDDRKGDTAAASDTATGDDTAPVDPVDADGDGYALGNDCDDDDAAVHPGATEVCNGVDDDCDGGVDIGATDPSTWYPDADGDGFGAVAGAVSGCDAPEGFVAATGDCDDTSGAVSPAAAEVCNGFDDDCDGLVDSADPALALLTTTGTLDLVYCWPAESCSTVAWPLEPDGTWVVGDTTGTWTWVACTGAIAMIGGNTVYTGTSGDRVHFAGTMHSENNHEDGTWTAELR
jgi:hypothetical protein